MNDTTSLTIVPVCKFGIVLWFMLRKEYYFGLVQSNFDPVASSCFYISQFFSLES